jgi:hypothetical protein
LSAACHSKSFPSSGLSVAHNGAIDAVDDIGYGFLAAVFKNVFLAGVVHQLVELELPCFRLIVYMAAMFVFGDFNRYSLK